MMKDFLDSLVNLIHSRKILKKHYHSLWGLVATELIWIALCLLIINKVIPPEITAYIKSVIGRRLFYISQSTFLCVGCLILILVWLAHRKLPKFKNKAIGILFICHYDDEINETMEQLQAAIEKEILPQLPISIKYATLNNMPKTENDCSQTLARSNASLLVKGHFLVRKLDDEKIIDLRGLTYTFPVVSAYMDIQNQFFIGPDLTEIIFEKDLTIKEKQSFTEIDIVSKNISELALYLLGTVSILLNKPDDAIIILNKLYTQLSLRALNDKFANMFLVKVKRAFADSYYNKALSLIKKIQVENLAKSTSVQEALTLTKNAIRLNAKVSSYYLTLGYLFFILENFSKSHKAIKIAKILAPKNDAMPYFSDAFIKFFMEGGNPLPALRELKQAFSKHFTSEGILDMAIFAEKCIKKYPEKISLHLVLGTYNSRALDSSIAIKDFQNFLDKTSSYQGKANLVDLIKYAEDEIKSLSKVTI